MVDESVKQIEVGYVYFKCWELEFISHSSSVISHWFKRRNELV